jgi:hypothetical protein
MSHLGRKPDRFPPATRPEGRRFFAIIDNQSVSMAKISLAAGYDVNSLTRWRRSRNRIPLDGFLDILSYLGYEITIQKKEKVSETVQKEIA